MHPTSTLSVDDRPSGRRRGRATATVVLELGLDETALAEALAWARARADELLAGLDDAELCALLEPPRARARAEGARDGRERVEAIEPPTPIARGAAVERRKTPRHSLVEPAVVSVESWDELVALYTRDIGSGGMFVQTDAPPPRERQVAVRLRLPDGAGEHDFEGVVVHVTTPEQAAATGGPPGFGMRFTGLTAERRRALQRLIAHAEAAAATGMLPPPPTYASLPGPWPKPESPVEDASARPKGSAAPQVGTGYTEEVRATNDHAVNDRAATDDAAETAPHEPSVSARRPRSTPPPMPPSPASMDADTIVVQQRTRRDRRLVRSLADRSDRLAARLERRDAAAASARPRDEHRAMVDEALRLVAEERYAEAIERLECVLRHRPGPRVRVLLGVVQARQALVERDFARARARYESVLRLDPDNRVAKRELSMLSALGQ